MEEEHVLAAVREGTTSFSGLVERLDAPVGELFLTCRRLESEGDLAATGPLVFRVTEDGQDRLEHYERQQGSPTAGQGAGREGGGESAEGGESEGDAADDGEEEAEGTRRFEQFDFRSEYREAGGSAGDPAASAPGDGPDAATAVPGGGDEPADAAAGETTTAADADASETGGDASDVAPAEGSLTAVEGIGETYAEHLREAGIESTADLAAADPAEVAAATPVSESRVQRWQQRL